MSRHVASADDACDGGRFHASGACSAGLCAICATADEPKARTSFTAVCGALLKSFIMLGVMMKAM